MSDAKLLLFAHIAKATDNKYIAIIPWYWPNRADERKKNDVKACKCAFFFIPLQKFIGLACATTMGQCISPGCAAFPRRLCHHGSVGRATHS